MVGDGGRGRWGEGSFSIEAVLKGPFGVKGGVVQFIETVEEALEGISGGGVVDFGDEEEAASGGTC